MLENPKNQFKLSNLGSSQLQYAMFTKPDDKLLDRIENIKNLFHFFAGPEGFPRNAFVKFDNNLQYIVIFLAHRQTASRGVTINNIEMNSPCYFCCLPELIRKLDLMPKHSNTICGEK